jgi:hypothetical protein
MAVLNAPFPLCILRGTPLIIVSHPGLPMSRSARIIMIVGGLGLFAGTLAWLRAGEMPAVRQSPAHPTASSPALPSKAIGNSVLSHGGPSSDARDSRAFPERAPAGPHDDPGTGKVSGR